MGPSEYSTASSRPAMPNQRTVAPLLSSRIRPAMAAIPIRLTPRRAMLPAVMMPLWMNREPPV